MPRAPSPAPAMSVTSQSVEGCAWPAISEPLATPLFRTRLTLNGETAHCDAYTLDAALAVAKAFEVEYAGNPEAYVSVRELDGSDAGQGALHHSRWLGEKAGPRDTRHPIEKLMRMAVRSGARVKIVDGGDVWEINPEPAQRRAA